MSLSTRLVDHFDSRQSIDNAWITDFEGKSVTQQEEIIQEAVQEWVSKEAIQSPDLVLGHLAKVFTVPNSSQLIQSAKKTEKVAEYFLEKTHADTAISYIKLPLAFVTVIGTKVGQYLPTIVIVPFSLFFKCVSLVALWWPFRVGTEMILPKKAELQFAEGVVLGGFHRIISLIEILFATFGIAELLSPADTKYDEESKGYKMMSLFQFFIALPATLLSIFELDAELGKRFGYVIVSILILSVIYPLIKPAPSTLPRGKNLSEKVRLGLDVKEGRRDYIERIVGALESGKKVLLVGKSGIGKTETVLAVSEAVTRGKIESLKGKEVFYFNTADLVDNGFMGNGEMLRQVIKKMGRNKNDVIVVFDELQEACKPGKRELLAQQLKTLLDKGCDSFPFFIGITTDEEYERDVMEQGAFSRRFETIFIEKPDLPEMIKILSDSILEDAPDVFLEDHETTLQYIAQQAREKIPELGQITNAVDPALEVLRECIKRTSESQRSVNEEVLQATREMRLQLSQGALADPDTLDQVAEKSSRLKEQFEAASTKAQSRQNELTQFFEMRKQLLEIKQMIMKMGLKVAEFDEKQLSQDEQQILAKYVLLGRFLAPQMKRHLVLKAKQLELKTVIDTELVDDVIQEIAAKRIQEADVMKKAKDAPAKRREVEESPKSDERPVDPPKKVFRLRWPWTYA
ncbi:AAA family ATPase [Simkania sp.]|uniref:AAA family ATPase n=1 Tax=Simkania sp. TaxID=34094 RepID=UPI003B52B754